METQGSSAIWPSSFTMILVSAWVQIVGNGFGSRLYSPPGTRLRQPPSPPYSKSQAMVSPEHSTTLNETSNELALKKEFPSIEPQQAHFYCRSETSFQSHFPFRPPSRRTTHCLT